MATTKRAPQRYKDRHGPLSGRWGRPGHPEVFTTGAMVSAVIDAGGVLERAAQALRCHPETLRRRAARSEELRRALSLMRSRSAEASFKRRERERRQRQREDVAWREAHGAAPRPRVVQVVYSEATQGLVQREVDALEAPALASPLPVVAEGNRASWEPRPLSPGRRHAPPAWAGPGWQWARLRREVRDKHHGVLLPGDEVLLPPRMAAAWIASGLAEAAEEPG